MGLSWQQGPLSSGAIGRFLVPEPLPKRLLYVEPLRRRMRVRFGGNWIADSENVLLLFEPGHYPMAYFPESDVSPNTLQRHRAYEPPSRSWAHILVHRPRRASRAHPEEHGDTSTCPRTQASCRDGLRSPGPPWMPSTKRTNGSWAMPPTATTASTSARHPVTSWSAIVTASLPILNGPSFSTSPASRRAGTFHVPTSMSLRSLPWSVRPSARTRGYAATTTSVTHIWRYGRILRHIPRSAASPNFLSFEPDIVSVQLDGKQLHLEPGQTVIPHGPDRELTVAEVLPRRKSA